MATTDRTGSIQLWDADLVVPIGEALHIRNLSSSVPARFSNDGRYLIVSGSEQTTWVKVWTADWPRIVCGLVTRNASPQERARHLGPLEPSGSCS